MSALSPQQRRKLRGLAHSLKPVVMIGQSGLSENIHSEIEIALDFHQLIKVRLRAGKEERQQWADAITARSKAEAVTSIGQILVLYRANPKRTPLPV